MLALIFGQHALEVRAARGQHDLVRLERMPVTGDRHVHERAILQQLVEHVGQVTLVVVPPQAELLVAGTAGRAPASLLGRRRHAVFGAVARLHGAGGGGGGWMLQCERAQIKIRNKKIDIGSTIKNIYLNNVWSTLGTRFFFINAAKTADESARA